MHVSVTINFGCRNDRIRQLHARGLSAPAIADSVGLTPTRVRQILDDMGCQRKRNVKADAAELLGPDLSYSIQITSGFPCSFSVHFEGAGCKVCQPEVEA